MTSPLLSSTDTVRQEGVPSIDGVLGFTPGTILLRRYRIIKLLGRGGMAEVYLADDLKLGEAVALKFLPADRPNPAMLDRLFREVRNGRQVAHPNVCRIYDVVEDERRHFIAMEYVDGVDLASLLKQVGRLPHEKALRVARDLCAGVAAAHAVGLLHRDLKPANVMIDGRGSPKVTDFGIAAFTHETSRNERSGTPIYMSPEQLAGEGVSYASDIYAIGLILHELFTGMPVFSVDTLTALLAAHREEKRRPSSLVGEIDAHVERVIMKCLDENPDARPRTVREILSMLPGRDAIDAALAAGETPLPQVVAAADVDSTLTGKTAASILGASALGIALILALTPSTMFYARVPLEKPPEVLADTSERIAASCGIETKGLRRYSWFERDEGSLVAARQWSDLRTMVPGALDYVSYWGGVDVVPKNRSGRLRFNPRTELEHLPKVVIDSAGRLKALHSTGAGTPPSFQTLIALAGLNEAARGSSASDTWQARLPHQAPAYVRVSRTSGLITDFSVDFSGQAKVRRASEFVAGLGLAPAWGGAALIVCIAATIITGVGLMLRNRRLGRIDQSGAMKVGSAIALVTMLSWICGADHAMDLQDEWTMIVDGVGSALFLGVTVWLFYAALEPSLRRRAPHVLVGWSRLLLGRFADPLVGRDVLIAIGVGISWNLFWRVINLLPALFGLPTLKPYGDVFEAFASLRGVAFRFFSIQATAVLFGLGVVFIGSSFLAMLRRGRLAFAASCAFLSVIGYPSIQVVHPQDRYFALLFALAMTSSWLWVAWRFGVLTLVVAIFVHFQLCAYPLTADPGSWFAGRSSLAIVALAAAALWAARTSMRSEYAG